MWDVEREQQGSDTLTPERVAASALHQSVRHERAIQACLAELAGSGTAGDPIAEQIRQRALRHAKRAIDLARTAIRVNRDPLAAPFLAAMLERHERGLRSIEDWSATGQEAALTRVG